MSKASVFLGWIGYHTTIGERPLPGANHHICNKIVAVREPGDALCTRDASRWLYPEILYPSGALGYADDRAPRRREEEVTM